MQILRLIAVGGVSWLLVVFARGEEPAPRPVVAWAAGPMEARIAFDRPIDPSVVKTVVGGSIAFGEVENPRTTSGRPGGDRGLLRVAAARLVDEGRTLVLITDPHPREAFYRITLDDLKNAGQAGAGLRVAVGYDLHGVEVAWTEKEGAKPSWIGWWPHTDPRIAREITTGSVDHDRLWPLASRPGRLTLRTLVTLPKGDVAVVVDAGSPFEATLGFETTRSVATAADRHRATIKAESTGESIELSLALQTGEGGPPRLQVSVGDAPLPRPSFALPWAPPSLPPSPAVTAPEWALTGGNPARGETVFHGEQAKCATCHKVNGKGGAIGPDLTNLSGRDRAWIYQNIAEPSVSIHPDYVSYTVAMKDGRIAMGVVRAQGADLLQVGDIDAKQTTFPRNEVEEIRPSASSIMPVGLLGAIGEEQTRDLLAFLTAPRQTNPTR